MHKAKEHFAKMERSHLIAACVVVVVLAAAIVAITVALVANTQKQTPATTTANFSVSGEMVCLPHKNTSGPQTLECAYGLRADDDRHYGLQFDAIPVDSVRIGQRVHAEGTLTTSTDGKYDIVGTIKLESLTKP